jgi:hypothetical protein
MGRHNTSDAEARSPQEKVISAGQAHIRLRSTTRSSPSPIHGGNTVAWASAGTVASRGRARAPVRGQIAAQQAARSPRITECGIDIYIKGLARAERLPSALCRLPVWLFGRSPT